MTVFEYLIEQEKIRPGFSFDRVSGGGLVISFPGYKHMDLFEVRDQLQQVYKLKLDFDKGCEEFDKICSRTFCYFKNVYTKKA